MMIYFHRGDAEMLEKFYFLSALRHLCGE